MMMNKTDQKNIDGKVSGTKQTGDAAQSKAGDSAHRTPGGPGWISLHSRLLWISGIVLVLAAWGVYMIIDN